MKYLFIIPRYTSVRSYYAPPLGIGYIIAALRADARDVAVINLNEVDGDTSSHLAAFDAATTVVLTGGLSVHYNQVNDIICTARDMGFRTVLGGGLLTAEPEFVFGLIKPTYGVIGEGEETCCELAAALDLPIPAMTNMLLPGIPGLIFERDGVVVRTADRAPIADLDSLPRVDYDAIGVPKLLERMTVLDEPYFNAVDVPRMVPVVASRSCPHSCSFCFHPTGSKYRKRGFDALFSELRHIVKVYKPNVIMFLDELFSVNEERLIDFCRQVSVLNVKWICQLHVKSVSEKALLMMKAAGCVCISYGVESADDGVLKAMHKHSTRADIDRALDMTYRAGIGIQGNLIFGTAGETAESWQSSIEWWHRNRRYQLNLIPVWPYPGSELYKIACERQKITDKGQYLANGCPPVNVTLMSDKECAEMVAEINRLQHTSSQFMNSECAVRHQPDGLLTVSYTCPHCKQQVELHNVPANNGMGRRFLRYACRKCNQRADFDRVLA